MALMTEDAVVSEVTATLSEWHKIWISLYLDNQASLFDEISNMICSLIDQRANLTSLLKERDPPQSINKVQQIEQLKSDIINKLDYGNRLLNLDLILRDSSYRLIDPIELSPLKLYQLHTAATTSLGTSSSHSQNNGFESDGSCLTNLTLSRLSLSSNEYSTINLPAKTSCHLKMTIKDHSLISLPTDETFELYFSIVEPTINNNNSPNQIIRPVTEKFLVQLQNNEMSCGVGSTVFTNVGPFANRDLCLYTQVYRVGKMTLADVGKTTFGKQPSTYSLSTQDNSLSSISSVNSSSSLARNRYQSVSSPEYRRPFGTAILALRDFVRSSNSHEMDLNFKVFSVSESDFSQIYDLYTKKNHSLKMSQNLPHIHLELTTKFVSCTQDKLQKLFPETRYCLTEKRGFPEIVMPGDYKNDLHLTLESAEFEKGGKSISKNIEASISLIDKDGLVIEGCISPGSNCNNISSYKSCVFYHSNSPKWNESIKINVPLTAFDTSHIRIEFRHCSTKERDKKFLGFAFLPLSDDDGTVIADKSHDLFIYKCDSQVFEDETLNLCKYACLPYGPAAKNVINARLSSHNFSHSNREMVTVNTLLLSTKLTQNSDLLNLLKWKELVKRNNKDFEDALNKVLVLKGDEILKFLQDILDTLFYTFTFYSTQGDDHSALIFKVLVHIFLLLEEPEYQQFKPVLDTYVSNHFSATLVYRGLLSCLKECLEHSSVAKRHAAIQRCFKSIKYIFQFIVQSKLLYSKATGENNDELFLRDLSHLFILFKRMLSVTDPYLMPLQATFLESFPGALDQLMKVIDAPELADLVIALAGRVNPIIPMARAKLIFMRETVHSGLIKDQAVRLRLIDVFCKQLDCYLKSSGELELCNEVLDILITKIHDCHWPSIRRLYQLTFKQQDQILNQVMTIGEITALMNSKEIQTKELNSAMISLGKELKPFTNLLNPILLILDRLVKDYTTNCIIVQKYFSCLLTVFKLMGKENYDQFVRKQKIDHSLLCNLFRSSRAVYNRDWSVMQLTSHAIVEYPINEISGDLGAENNSHPSIRQRSSYLNLIVDFITHPTLQLEAFSDRKRAYVLNTFGDLRIKFASQLVGFWAKLTEGGYISDLIPTSIQPFLDASMLPNDELQRKLIPVFYDMINAEDTYNSKSRQFERCLIDNLDLFMNLDRGNYKFMNNFDSILKTLITEQSPGWQQRGFEIINSFTKLMKMLMDYRKSLEAPESPTKRMCYLVDLLNFYRDQDCFDLHLNYLFKLSDMHLELGNYVEAAFTLKLYTDEMTWRDRSLSPLEGYQLEEKEWRRKEALYLRIIHYFDQGRCWEEAIPLCNELAWFYENILLDYAKWSTILKELANYLDRILSIDRHGKTYYKVEFLGTDSPEFVRNKEFIYRAGDFEMLSSFRQRMIAEFPDVTVINSRDGQTMRGRQGQYLVILKVNPVPSLQEQLKNGHINDKIIDYYLNNRIDTFSYDLPLRKGVSNPKDAPGDASVKNLWLGRHVLKTKTQLPNLLPWSEVVSQEYIEVTPINYAIESISSMNFELTKLILSYKNDPGKQINPLTMRLQGVIEAAVNGGPSVFIKAFLHRQPNDPLEEHVDLDSLRKLRDLIEQQCGTLDTGLALHSKLAPPEILPLHTRLVKKLQATVISLQESSRWILPTR